MDDKRLARIAATVAASTAAGPVGVRIRAEAVAGLNAGELREVERVLQRSADFLWRCQENLPE